ncbi:hypothetical protein MBLNU459_g3248t1 [Dothideomycetes sp. NU459]
MGPENAAPPTAKVSEVVATYRPTRVCLMQLCPIAVPLFPNHHVECLGLTYLSSQLFKTPGLHYTSLDFDTTGELLLLARTDDTLQIYNTKAGAHAKELKSQKYGCALARFTHHAQSLIYASTKIDDGIRYLSTHDNSYIRYFRGHQKRVTSLTMCPSGDTFLSASQDDTVKLWDLRSANAQGSMNLHGAYLTAYDPSATVIAIASPPTQTILLYDVRNFDKPPFATFDLLDIERRYAHFGQRPGEGWTSLEFSNNGQYVLLATNGAGHFVLDAFDGSLKAFLHRPQGPTPVPASLSSEGQQPTLQGDACFTSDGRYVVSGSAQSGLLVWDMLGEKRSDGTMQPMTDLPGPKTSTVVGVNPRYNLLATAGSEVMLWLPDPDLA